MTPFRHILVPTDFGPASERAEALAVELCRAFDARLTLLHVYEVPSYSYLGGLYAPIDFVTPVSDAAQAELDRALAALKEKAPQATATLRGGIPWIEVLQAAKEAGADLVVMGTHGRRGMTHALLGSVAEKIVRMAEVPVLTVHAEGAEAAAAKPTPS